MRRGCWERGEQRAWGSEGTGSQTSFDTAQVGDAAASSGAAFTPVDSCVSFPIACHLSVFSST